MAQKKKLTLKRIINLKRKALHSHILDVKSKELKFYYKQKVRIINGFYKSSFFIIEDYHEGEYSGWVKRCIWLPSLKYAYISEKDLEEI